MAEHKAKRVKSSETDAAMTLATLSTHIIPAKTVLTEIMKYVIWIVAEKIYIIKDEKNYILVNNNFVLCNKNIDVQKSNECAFIPIHARIIVKIINGTTAPTRTFYDFAKFSFNNGKIVHGIGIINYYNGSPILISKFTTTEIERLTVEFDNFNQNVKHRQINHNGEFLSGLYNVKINGVFSYIGLVVKVEWKIKITRKVESTGKIMETTTNDFFMMNKLLE